LLGAVLLGVLVRAGVTPLLAQAVQLVVTLALNFTYNYKITWRDRPRTGLPKKVAWFLATRGATQVASWFAFAGLIALSLQYQVANAVCLAGAMAVNFVTSDKLVFRSGRRRPGRRRAARRPDGVWGRYWRRALTATLAVIGLTGAWYLLHLPALPTVLLFIAVFNLAIGAMETRWRLYGWRTPDAEARMAWPAPVAPGAEAMAFSLIIPARDEASVIGDTLRRLLKQTHTFYRIVVSLCDDDGPSIAAVHAVARTYPGGNRITTVVRHYDKPSKPLQLNAALGSCTGDVVGVIDAEDDVAEDLLLHVEAMFQASDADVVQGGVQLMNLGRSLGKWFQVHNVLEYFFWFTSRMAYQSDAGFVPLGGNTVFIRRHLLEAAGGWPLSLTEDCALGVVLATRFGASVATAYSPALSTREESPPSIFNRQAGALFWQRDRWVRGFLAEFMAGKWLKMPTLRQRLLAGYILATPFLQAVAFVLFPLAILTVLLVKTPIAVAMLVFAPLVPIGLTVLTQLIGLREFSRLYQQRASIWHYSSVLFLTPLYQMVLAAAAAAAAHKYATGDTTWYKTGRAAEHRREDDGADLAFEGAAA
jgi:cellulose synthase/poly-beta-1,6-N-acetylglucosamine synthase-like glycosyltransferase/putative flippase GtrA